jgi:4-diphosphocytidyl-2-C-methyl-D-erythritol kinase
VIGTAAPATVVVCRRAHAKINLSLGVGPADPASEPPGMHPISSWMAAVEFADDLELRALPPGQPSRHRVEWAPDAPRPGAVDWPVEKDLAARAHRLLEARAGRVLPVDILLRKRIPVGGGLGGGSSDGAAALIGLNDLFGLGLSAKDLRVMSRSLGSDVAFFIDDVQADAPRPGVVGGFGDRVERVAPVAASVLLLVPGFATPTGPVYRAYDAAPGPLREADVRLVRARAAAAGRIDPAGLFNDLEAPACAVEPRLAEVLARVRGVGVRVHLSGSGSTMFVVDPGSEVAGAIRAAAPELVLVGTRLVTG